MMKYFFIFFTFVVQDFFCQGFYCGKTLSKNHIATLAGIKRGDVDGTCTIKKLFENKKLSLINNIDSLKIISFEVDTQNNLSLKVIACNSDSLSSEAVKTLQSIDLSLRPKVFIQNIKAVNRDGKRYHIDGLYFRLTK